MSAEDFFSLRQRERNELTQLAQEHFKHDLTENDRTIVKSAASRVVTYSGIGTVLGLSLGAFLAYRRRQFRTRMFQSFRATEKPTHVRFADGREEAIPDVTALAAPSTAGSVLTYLFFGSLGTFLGGQLGTLAGTTSAMSMVKSEPETAKRVEVALRKLRIDVLKRQIEQLERRDGAFGSRSAADRILEE